MKKFKELTKGISPERRKLIEEKKELIRKVIENGSK